MNQQQYPHMPFYMTYPIPTYYNDDDIIEKDLDYMKELYPDLAKKVQSYIEEACDRMDYKGSMIYDDYPDKIMLRKTAKDIYDKIKNFGDLQFDVLKNDDNQEHKVYSMNYPPYRRCWDGSCIINDLIEILLFNEIFRRRHRRPCCW